MPFYLGDSGYPLLMSLICFVKILLISFVAQVWDLGGAQKFCASKHCGRQCCNTKRIPNNGVKRTKEAVATMNSDAHVKRPMNCFMVWSREKRHHILKEHPGINNAEVSKALGAAWKKLSEEDKEPYVEEARRLKEQHKMENPGYKYQPKRRNSKIIKRRAQKTFVETTKHYSKSSQRIKTGEKIHFPSKYQPASVELLKPVNVEDKPLLCFPPALSGRVQCFPPSSFQPSAVRFCSCHVFYASTHCHPAWTVESVSPSHQFYGFDGCGSSCLQAYDLQGRLQADYTPQPYIHNWKLWELTVVCIYQYWVNNPADNRQN